MKNHPLRALVAFLVGATALSLVGADHPNQQRGSAAGGRTDAHGVDRVNLFNGNLNVTVPLGQVYHVDGSLSYQLALHYSGNNWEYATFPRQVCTGGTCTDVYRNQSYPHSRSNAGLGWLLSLGKMTMENFVLLDGTTGRRPVSYESPDGGVHDWFDTLHEGETPAAGSTVRYTRDSTYLRVRKITYQNDFGVSVPGWDVEFPDGIVHRFNDAGRIIELRDRQGNETDVQYGTQADSSPIWTIREPQDRRIHYVRFKRIPVSTEGRPQGFPDPAYFDVVKEVDLAAFGGQRAVYKFQYGDTELPCDSNTPIGAELVEISRQYMVNFDTVIGPTTLTPLLRRIVLPDCSTYSMIKPSGALDYDRGDGINLSNHLTLPAENRTYSGHLTGLTLPTLGRLEWTYQTYTFPNESGGSSPAGQSLIRSIGVAERRQMGSSGSVQAKWQYQTQLITAAVLQRRTLINTLTAKTAVDATISRTVNYFTVDTTNGVESDYGLPFSRDPDPENAGDPDVTNPDPTSSSRFISTKIYDAAGELQRYTYVRYEGETIYSRNKRLSSQRTVFPTDGDRWIAVDHSDFDGLGHYRTVSTSGNIGNDASSVTTSFNRRDDDVSATLGLDVGTWGSTTDPFEMPATTEPWVLNTFTSVTKTEAGDTVKSLYCFDAATGALLRRRTLAGSSPGGTDLVTRLSWLNGNLTREESFGGDLETGAAGLETTPLCALPLAEPKYRIDHTYQNGSLSTSRYWDSELNIAMESLLADSTIDPSTGLPSSSRDSAEVETNYVYDALGRLTWSKPAGAAWTESIHKRAGEPSYPQATILVNTRPNGAPSATPLTQVKVELDGFGRPTSEYQLMPSGSWSRRDTRYHPMGWREKVSELAATPVYWTEFEFDLFGRPVRSLAPDGTDTLFEYSGIRTTTRKRNIGSIAERVATVEEYDRFGRLVKVTEKSGPTSSSNPVGSSVVTEYSYDVGGRLRHVKMTGAESPPAIQERRFTYDRRGFLVGESHPESGDTTYSGLDARGHALLKKQSNANSIQDLRFTFDAGERVRIVEYRNPFYDPLQNWGPFTQFRPLKEFAYGSDNSGTDKKKGKLASAVRYNYSPYSPLYAYPSRPMFKVAETYGYHDAAGRLTTKTTTIIRQDTPFVSPEVTVRTIGQNFAYNDLGLPSQISYPECFPCGVPPIANPDRNLSPGYTAGRLTSIPGFVDSISYSADGSVYQIAHTSGIHDTYQADPHGMARPQSISFSPWTDCGTPVGIAAQPQNAEVASGGSTTLLVVASGTAPFSYQWHHLVGLDWSPIPGATGPSYPTPTLSSTRSYRVEVKNGCRTVMSNIATVTVNSCTTPSISTQPQSQTIAAGASVLLQVTASGSGTLAYQWYFGASGDQSSPVGSNSPSYPTPPLSATARYWVKITNSCGSVSSATAVLTVPLPAPGGLQASRTGGAVIRVTWTASAGSHHYELQRRSGGVSDFVTIFSPASGTTMYEDMGRTGGVTYVYRIRAVDAVGGSLSPWSNYDLATMMTFTPIVAGQNVVDDQHMHELLTALNALRGANGWATVAWAEILPAGVPAPAEGTLIRAAHVQTLRNRINEALQGLGVTVSGYADPDLTLGIRFKTTHIEQLRERTQ